MEDKIFWQIIDMYALNGHEGAYLNGVIERLSLTSVPDVYGFQIALHKKMKNLCNWNCYGVFLLIEIVIDDEKFHDFRLWIIARGEVFYNTFLQDPELVADDLLATYEGDMPYLQGLSSVAGNSLLRLKNIAFSKDDMALYHSPVDNAFKIGESYGFIADLTGEKLSSDEEYQRKYPKIFDATEGEFLRYKEKYGL